MNKSLLTIFIVFLWSLSFQSKAVEINTLEEIARAQVINIGFRNSSIPYSYLQTPDSKIPIGYTIDICNKIAEAIKTNLKMPNLKVNYILVSGSDRIPKLLDNTIDMECGSSTHAKERERFIAFSTSIYIDQENAVVRKSDNYRSIKDLDGKTLAVDPGSAFAASMRLQEKREDYHFNRVYVADQEEAFTKLLNKKADAFVIGAAIAAGLVTFKGKEEEFGLLHEGLADMPTAIMFRKNNPQFKALVNSTIKELFSSNEMEKIYKKWFLDPLPGRNGAIGFQLSEANIKLFKSPNDEAADDGIPFSVKVFTYPTWTWSLSIVAFYIFASIVGMYAFRSRVHKNDDHEKKDHYRFSEKPLDALGVTAALILGFTLVTTITTYNHASDLVVNEANAISLVQKNTQGFSDADRTEIRELLTQYVNIVVSQEWLDQMQGLPTVSFPGNKVLDKIHKKVVSLDITKKPELSHEKDLLLDNLTTVYSARTERLFAASPDSNIPPIMWLILVMCSFLCIMAVYLIGFTGHHFHLFGVSSVSILLALFIVLILYTDRPYLGPKAISSEPYVITVENFIWK